MADEEVVPAVVDHAEKIGEHTEKLKVLEDGQAAIATVVGGVSSSLDNVGNRLASLEEAQFKTADALAELRAEKAAKEEVEEVKEQATGEAAKPDESKEESPKVDAPEQVTPENKKRTSPLGWFHKVFGGGD